MKIFMVEPIVCAFVLLGAGMNTGKSSEAIVIEQIQKFEERKLEDLFENYYSPDLKVYFVKEESLYKDFQKLNRESDEAVEYYIRSLSKYIGPVAFESMDVLKSHVRKQFEETKDLKLELLESFSKGEYAFVLERKVLDGAEVKIYGVYRVAGGLIVEMWLQAVP